MFHGLLNLRNQIQLNYICNFSLEYRQHTRTPVCSYLIITRVYIASFCTISFTCNWAIACHKKKSIILYVLVTTMLVRIASMLQSICIFILGGNMIHFLNSNPESHIITLVVSCASF